MTMAELDIPSVWNITSVYNNPIDKFTDWNNHSYFDITYLQSLYNELDQGLLFKDIEMDLYLDLRPLNVFLIVLYALVFIVGLLGNMFVITVIIRFKSMRTLTNFFLVNLTLGDILVILICIPMTLGSTIYKKWIYGSVLCKLTPFIQGSAVSVSVLSLLSISASRYFAIHKPLTAKIMFSTRNVRIMLVVIWIISFGSFTPLLIINNVSTFSYGGLFESKICEEKWNTMNNKHIFNIFIFCILFLIPFLIMAAAYSEIGHTLWIGNTILFRDDSKSSPIRNNQILKQRRRTVKILVCVIVIFGMCWLPYYVVNLWLDFSINDHSKVEQVNFVYANIYPIVVLIALANSAVNPICYCFLSHGFRRGFNKMFCNGYLKRSGSILRSSWKFKATVSESIVTDQV